MEHRGASVMEVLREAMVSWDLVVEKEDMMLAREDLLAQHSQVLKGDMVPVKEELLAQTLEVLRVATPKVLGRSMEQATEVLRADTVLRNRVSATLASLVGRVDTLPVMEPLAIQHLEPRRERTEVVVGQLEVPAMVPAKEAMVEAKRDLVPVVLRVDKVGSHAAAALDAEKEVMAPAAIKVHLAATATGPLHPLTFPAREVTAALAQVA